MDQMIERVSTSYILGVTYHHYKTHEGGDLYLTRFGEPYRRHLDIESWYEHGWFAKKRQKLLGTSAVYKVPTKDVDGHALNLVVKYSRVGEDVPLNTHTLEEYCNAEFNSPWEEFSLVMEIFDSPPGDTGIAITTQQPLAIYVPSETMQLWQSGRSRHRISKIRARHPSIDLDILRQYILVYGWIDGKNLIEMFEHIDVPLHVAVEDIKAMDAKATRALAARGYYVADMKPQHVIIHEEEARSILALSPGPGPAAKSAAQIEALHDVLDANRHAVIDYELLYRTPEHEERIKSMRRHTYLDDQRDRFSTVRAGTGLLSTKVMGVPYVYGHVESTGGRLWVVGSNARLFDYFLPERWRKTNARSMSEHNEVYYTLTKDNIHIVWKTSRVGELPAGHELYEAGRAVEPLCINSPFEEAAIAMELQKLGIYTVYYRAIYMTGARKVEVSQDMRKYESHAALIGPEGRPILDHEYNYISVRGYFNGTDEWVSAHSDALFTPMDLDHAFKGGIVNEQRRADILAMVKAELGSHGYDGGMLRYNDVLVAVDGNGKFIRRHDGEIAGIICNLEFITKRQ